MTMPSDACLAAVILLTASTICGWVAAILLHRKYVAEMPRYTPKTKEGEMAARAADAGTEQLGLDGVADEVGSILSGFDTNDDPDEDDPPDIRGPPETFEEAERRGMYQAGPNPTKDDEDDG